MGKTTIKTSTNEILLWENPSPWSTFGAQTISVPNINKYNFIKVKTKVYGTTIIDIVQRNGSGEQTLAYCTSNTLYRTMRVNTDETITFSAGTLFIAYNGQSGQTNNDIMVPYQIYGIINMN